MADIYEQTELIPVLDYSACITKSDMLMTEELRQQLVSDVKRLGDMLEEQKDWHPRSRGQVLDPVHPTLYPLVYGHTRALSDRRIGLRDCLDCLGDGKNLPVPDGSKLGKDEDGGPRTRALRIWAGSHPLGTIVPALSPRFQWLHVMSSSTRMEG